MVREREMDNAPAAVRGQSKHPDPPDTHSHVSAPAPAPAPHQTRQKTQHQKQHHVGGRPYNRVPSAKVLHTKSHQHTQPAPRLTRRTTSPGERESHRRPTNDRRANSEVKLSRGTLSANLSKSVSHSSLNRNPSTVDLAKRNPSCDKLVRNPATTPTNKHKHPKSQVTFDIGIDDPEDEWVDASGSNSPHVSRKGSLIINSGPSSLQQQQQQQQNPASKGTARPQTSNLSAPPSAPIISPADQERARHKEYLTSRVLKRTVSHAATTQMTSQMAQADLPRHSPEPDGMNGSLSTSGNQNSLTSRFVGFPGSGIASDSSLSNALNSSRQQLPTTVSPRIHSSSTTLLQDSAKPLPLDTTNSALVPQATIGRSTAPRAETSRTQQKLNLQRQSSALEPGQVVGAVGGATGPLIGIGGAGYDGASSRDPRVHRLMERTGMEYLVVRRCQNPIARSLKRLGRLPELELSKRIPRSVSPLASGKRPAAMDAQTRHTRNASMPDSGPLLASRRGFRSIWSNGAGSSFEGDEVTRLSGSSAAGGEEVDDTATLLRNLWDRPMELSTSTE